jgi:hypothetical protein
MRKTMLLLPLCAAGMFLMSCVTAPAPKRLVAELFDSAAITASAQELIGERSPLPEPSIAALTTEARASSASPVADVQPPAAHGPGLASVVPAALVPGPAAAETHPVPSPRPDSPGLIPLSPPKAVKFALAVPVAPLAAPAMKASPPARQAPPKPPKAAAVTTPPKPSASVAAPASKAASSSAPPVQAPAPAVAAAVPAAAGSAAAASGAAATPAPANSYGRLREIYARQGDELQVGLDGIGFLFLGFPDRSPLADGMSFKGKEIRNGKTWFTFQALKLGTYDLDFLRQENTTGKSDKETVRVHVVTEQDFSAAVSPQPGGGGDSAVETGDTAFAGKLTSAGAYASALAELQKGYHEGNPALNDQIAVLYMKMGSYDLAGKYYAKNIAPPSGYTQRAVVGLVSIAVAQKDQKALMASLKQFLAVRDPSVEEPLVRAIRMETDRSEIGLGLDLGEEYIARYPSGRWRDEVDFLMANLLEGNSQFRDIARARALYRGILDNDPESTFAAAAREHLSYIDRHFYQVR